MTREKFIATMAALPSDKWRSASVEVGAALRHPPHRAPRWVTHAIGSLDFDTWLELRDEINRKREAASLAERRRQKRLISETTEKRKEQKRTYMRNYMRQRRNSVRA